MDYVNTLDERDDDDQYHHEGISAQTPPYKAEVLSNSRYLSSGITLQCLMHAHS